ncbi:Uncharacterized protein APZ42_026269 [Daphnia magna]|uniref:Uncharacterized protein n=1 Tax=Daphnia magna TaxID=35525 RepID=A0A164SAQ7_9CRUS|nr:Uncharacterized protein APZ42_026269 [Daphnia magna]
MCRRWRTRARSGESFSMRIQNKKTSIFLVVVFENQLSVNEDRTECDRPKET